MGYFLFDGKPLGINFSPACLDSFLIHHHSCSSSFSHICYRLFWGSNLSISYLCSSAAFTFFDPNDPACLEILMDPRTTIPELFAIVRQWVPQVQHKIDIIGNEVSAH